MRVFVMLGRALAALTLPLALGACEFGPKQSTQTGFRGTGMSQIVDTDLVAYLQEKNVVPPAPYDLDSREGERAGDFYENVQVLGDLSTEEFNRLMLGITEWIVPQAYRDDPNNAGGCNYCHNPANMASDEVYTKVVARRMVQMTRTINTGWQTHVKGTGVTCWTCHRGQPVPANVWAEDINAPRIATMTMGTRAGRNTPVADVAYTTLPYDPFSPYLSSEGDAKNIRVIGEQSLASQTRGAAIYDTYQSQALMMHMSYGLGVNCAYCHNTRAFAEWDQSNVQRTTAWYGLRMVRAVNETYITPLTPVFPPHRLGPKGDALKVNCATCHQGVAKPLNGVSMLGDWPELARLNAPAPAAAPAPAMENP